MKLVRRLFAQIYNMIIGSLKTTSFPYIHYIKANNLKKICLKLHKANVLVKPIYC